MALLHTPEKEKSFHAPPFHLKATDGTIYGLKDIRGEKGTLVLFICNHCPYVLAVIDRLVEDCRILQENGIGIAAIMPNDTQAYPEDSFEKMQVFAKENNFTFPYLIDSTQDTARAYGAVCTPDIFGFDADSLLQYRGRIDSAGMNKPAPDIKHELREAMLDIGKTGVSPLKQTPSMGCSIKWKE